MISINKLVTNSIVITIVDPRLKIPLYFEANESGASVAMLCWDDYYNQQTDLKCHLQYSTDKMATWEIYDGSIVDLDDCTDNRVYFRADPENPNTDGFCKQDWDHEEWWTHYFKTDGSVEAGGNIQFLLESTGTRVDVPAHGFQNLFGKEEYDEETGQQTSSCQSLTTAPALPATTLAQCCYQYMFHGCTSLATAPALPAMTLADYCYTDMFSNCSSLTTAPALPATTLASSCYGNMFYGCTSLTTAPALPATTLAEQCYGNMFHGCSSLTTAPALPAMTLADYCYTDMFYGCSNLASIDVNFTIWATGTRGWVNGVAASGTFTCPAALPKTIGNSNIPSGWTIIEK